MEIPIWANEELCGSNINKGNILIYYLTRYIKGVRVNNINKNNKFIR